MRFQRIKWSDTAKRFLLRAMQEDVDLIRQSVENGYSMLWSVNDGESYLITRAEPPDLVCVCYEGCDALEVATILAHSARVNGYRALRLHTNKPALLRLLRPLNPEPIEYVARIYTDGRQQQKLNQHESKHDERAGYRHDDGGTRQH